VTHSEFWSRFDRYANKPFFWDSRRLTVLLQNFLGIQIVLPLFCAIDDVETLMANRKRGTKAAMNKAASLLSSPSETHQLRKYRPATVTHHIASAFIFKGFDLVKYACTSFWKPERHTKARNCTAKSRCSINPHHVMAIVHKSLPLEWKLDGQLVFGGRMGIMK
jgi:hypothetical protein